MGPAAHEVMSQTTRDNNIQGVPKKWCTFENAGIRNGKQVETLFFTRIK